MPIYKMQGSKNGKQKYRVRINYTDAYGRAKQIDRVEYGAAEAKELERILSYEIKQQSPARAMTMRELFTEYVNVKKYEIRESSLEKSKTILETHVLPYFENTKIDKLTVPMLQDWKRKINEKTYPCRDGGERNLMLSTKKNAYAAMRALLNFAVEMEYLKTNPLKKIGNFKDADHIKEPIQFYTAEEFAKFISCAKESAENAGNLAEYDYYVFFSIAFYMGLRKGEIYALKWSDINGNILSVSRSITQKLKGGDRETPPKNKSSIRKIQIPKPLMKILKEHRERYEKIDCFTEDFRICGGTAPVRDTSIEKANKKYAGMAGVKKIRIHDFRHSHASLLANSGINIQEIARRLGHSNVEITWNTYSHLYPREEERATEILNKIV